MKEVRVPEERVGVLIGESGETKKDIEELLDINLEIKDNLAVIKGDALDERTAHRVVKAIGRGFNPEKALRLVEKDVTFHMLDITKFADTKNSEERLKGRVIGRNGETRRHLEKEGNVEISVYGKTIGVIGYAENIHIVTESIKMLLKGSTHSTAYQYLEKNQEKIRR